MGVNMAWKAIHQTPVKVHTLNGIVTENVFEEEIEGEIHISKTTDGYKLSLRDRDLNLGELLYLVNKMNAIYMYGV